MGGAVIGTESERRRKEGKIWMIVEMGQHGKMDCRQNKLCGG